MNDFESKINDIKDLKENILTDTILYNQLPFSSDNPDSHKEFIINRLHEMDVPKIERDDVGNIMVEYFHSPSLTKKSVLVMVPMNLKKISRVDRLIQLDKDKMHGRGIIDNSLKVTAFLNLIDFLFKYKIEFKYNIIFLFLDFSNIEENFKTLNYFLSNCNEDIVFALDIDSISLGDIGYKSLGKYLYKIWVKTKPIDLINICDCPNKLSAMDILTEIGARLKSIGWPEKSCTFINIIDIKSKSKVEAVPSEGVMKLELLSRKSQYLEYENQILTSTINKMSRELDTKIQLELVGHSSANYFMANHPFIDEIIKIHKQYSIESSLKVIRDEAAVLLQKNIPTVSLGIAEGQIKIDDEYITKDSIIVGIKQVLKVLKKGISFFEKKEEE